MGTNKGPGNQDYYQASIRVYWDIGLLVCTYVPTVKHNVHIYSMYCVYILASVRMYVCEHSARVPAEFWMIGTTLMKGNVFLVYIQYIRMYVYTNVGIFMHTVCIVSVFEYPSTVLSRPVRYFDNIVCRDISLISRYNVFPFFITIIATDIAKGYR